MCKVFAMSNMGKVKVTKKLVRSVKDAVTGNGKGDNDGFGYSVLGEDGAIGGERTTRPIGFQAYLNDKDNRIVSTLPFVNHTRNSFGTVNIEAPKAFIGHGRYSTNDATLENTHPYYNGDVSLIHNGVVRDPDQVIKNLTTTNDTEILLRCWEQGGMPMIEERVAGYYAMAILDKTGKLHIIRDDRAMLYISYCRTADSYIFATTAEIIKKVAKDMKWQTEEPVEVQENVHIVLDRNDFTFEAIQPRVDSYRGQMDAKTRHSLGLPETGNYGGWGGHSRFNSTETGVVDATRGVESEEDDEPSYRENKREAAALEAEIDADLDRALIDDGAPNVVDARFSDEENESYEGYEDAYTGRRIGNY